MSVCRSHVPDAENASWQMMPHLMNSFAKDSLLIGTSNNKPHAVSLANKSMKQKHKAAKLEITS